MSSLGGAGSWGAEGRERGVGAGSVETPSESALGNSAPVAGRKLGAENV